MDPLAQRVASRFVAIRKADSEHHHELDDPRIPKIERLLGSVSREVRQMGISLEQFKHDPAKYQPQLKNLADAASTAVAGLTIILRTL